MEELNKTIVFGAGRFEQFLAALGSWQNLFSCGFFAHGVIQLGRCRAGLHEAHKSENV